MNVLFITGDQWRASCLSSAGHPLIKTPNLDKLASKGVRFASHYTQSTPCGPSRSCLHTSTYIHSNSAFDNGSPMTANLTNWANELTNNGYTPKLIGYVDTVELELSDPKVAKNPDNLLWDGGNLKGLTRLTETDVMGTPEWLQKHNIPLQKETMGWNGYRGSNEWQKESVPQSKSKDTKPQAKRAVYSQDATDTKVLTDRAIQYIRDESNVTAQPWALHLSLLKPHPPWVATVPFVNMYTSESVNAKMNKIRSNNSELEMNLHPWLACVHGVNATEPTRSNSVVDMNDETLDALKATYYALVSELDHHLGRVFQTLHETNQWENTLIIVTADHGEQLGDHYLIGKLGFYDQSYHIPFIVRDPRKISDSTRGSTIPASIFTEAVDVAPTILDACNIAKPAQFQGNSIIPLLALNGNKYATWNRPAVHWEVDWRWWTMPGSSAYPQLFENLCNKYDIGPDERSILIHRTHRWKLIVFNKMDPLLFDLTDGKENRNLSKSVQHRDVLASLMMDCLHWKMKYSGNVGNNKNEIYRIGYDNLLKKMGGIGNAKL